MWRKNRSSRLHPVTTNRTCPGCGAKFNSWGKIRQIYCSPQCGGARLTSQDTDTINAFRHLCERYNLSAPRTWAAISGYLPRSFYWPTSRVRKGGNTRGNYRQGLLSPQTKNRYMAMMAKFVKEFKEGKYDLIPPDEKYKNFNYKPRAKIKRRLTPGRPECPMKLHHCAGGLFPGDCPKHWRECPLWSN